MSARAPFFAMSFSCMLLAVAACAFAADASSDGACTQPAARTQAAAVDVPDYAAEASAPPDPDETAAQAAWKQYAGSVLDALKSSSDPRDWAIAALIGNIPSDESNRAFESIRANSAVLATRAAAAAPNDSLVQWLALASLHSSDTSDIGPLQALQSLESDNEAVWLESLNAATHAKDSTGTDIALERMADSKSFDLHLAAIAQAIADVYRRYPMPDSVNAYAQALGTPITKDTMADIMGSSLAMAFILPAFQDLVLACRVDPSTGDNVLHAPDCARIGRMMATQSDTYLANRIGFAVLRTSQTFTDADVESSRRIDWIMAQHAIADSASVESPQADIAYLHDWYVTGNEVEAMRRAVARAGKPLEPPVDWIDKNSPFSAQRLQSDKDRLSKAAPAN